MRIVASPGGDPSVRPVTRARRPLVLRFGNGTGAVALMSLPEAVSPPAGQWPPRA